MVPRSAMGSVGGETHGSVTEGPAAPSADGDRDRVFFEDEAIRDSRFTRRRVDSGLEGSPGEVSIFDLESIFAASPGNAAKKAFCGTNSRAKTREGGGFFSGDADDADASAFVPRLSSPATNPHEMALLRR